jgi:hypothetical protein
MELDLGGIVPAAVAGPDDAERLVAVLMEMQKGINLLTGVLVAQKAEIAVLRVEVSRLKARTDAPKRGPAIVFPKEAKWPN